MVKRRRLVSEEFWKWSSENASFIGTLSAIDQLPYQDKTITQYTFTRDGSDVRMNATDQLVKAMSNVAVGEEVEILFQGTQRTGSGFDVQLFQVFVLEEDASNGDSK